MVVPFVKHLENPDEKYLTDIDTEMSKILTQDSLSIDQKVKLYNRALEKFTQHYDPNLFVNFVSLISRLIFYFLIVHVFYTYRTETLP